MFHRSSGLVNGFRLRRHCKGSNSDVSSEFSLRTISHDVPVYAVTVMLLVDRQKTHLTSSSQPIPFVPSHQPLVHDYPFPTMSPYPLATALMSTVRLVQCAPSRVHVVTAWLVSSLPRAVLMEAGARNRAIVIVLVRYKYRAEGKGGGGGGGFSPPPLLGNLISFDFRAMAPSLP